MNRDFSKFPEDDSGNALWNMVQQGDDLSVKRDVEFTVIFTTEKDALNFGQILLFNRQQVRLCDNEASVDYPFEIVATLNMIPNHNVITEYEDLLQQHAAAFNGINDGWGSFAP